VHERAVIWIESISSAGKGSGFGLSHSISWSAGPGRFSVQGGGSAVCPVDELRLADYVSGS
jgi:hypothetical protein